MSADLNDDEGWAMDAEFTIYRCFGKGAAKLTAMPLIPKQCAGCGSILGCGAFAVERAVEMLHGLAQFRCEAFHEKWVGFKDAEKISRARLAVTEDGEGIRVVAEGLSLLVNLADAFAWFGEDRQVLPLVRDGSLCGGG